MFILDMVVAESSHVRDGEHCYAETVGAVNQWMICIPLRNRRP